jgi:hypothetical protein
MIKPNSCCKQASIKLIYSFIWNPSSLQSQSVDSQVNAHASFARVITSLGFLNATRQALQLSFPQGLIQPKLKYIPINVLVRSASNNLIFQTVSLLALVDHFTKFRNFFIADTKITKEHVSLRPRISFIAYTIVS